MHSGGLLLILELSLHRFISASFIFLVKDKHLVLSVIGRKYGALFQDVSASAASFQPYHPTSLQSRLVWLLLSQLFLVHVSPLTADGKNPPIRPQNLEWTHDGLLIMWFRHMM